MYLPTFRSIATICARVPHAIVCLLSALAIHDIGTQQPPDVWIALDRKARKPHFVDEDVRVVRFSGAMLRHGVTTRRVQGVPVRLTDPARTVVDCFRYRNKLGLDIALEALRDVLTSRRATVDALVRAAQACRNQFRDETRSPGNAVVTRKVSNVAASVRIGIREVVEHRVLDESNRLD